MKKDLPFLIGGLALGAVVFLVFKDNILGKKEKSAPAQTPPTTGGSVSGGSVNTGMSASNQGMQSQAPSTQTQQEQAAPPYELVPIEPQLVGTEYYEKMFGGCSFPILPNASNRCVEKLQEAFDVERTGSFDMATQEAFDKYIENMPNRSQGDFKGWGIQGCITFDPATGSETNTCGLNHDQYLDILFKMGIPLTDENL